MPLSDSDKKRAMYHLGYMLSQPAPSLQLGMPRVMQTQFLAAIAVEIIVEEFAVPKALQILNIMDGIECRLVDAQGRLALLSTGSTKMRENEPDLLEAEYVRWGMRLADLLGTPIYKYSTRYSSLVQVSAGNIRVARA